MVSNNPAGTLEEVMMAYMLVHRMEDTVLVSAQNLAHMVLALVVMVREEEGTVPMTTVLVELLAQLLAVGILS